MGMMYNEQHGKNTMAAQQMSTPYTTMLPSYTDLCTQKTNLVQLSEQQRYANIQNAQNSMNVQSLQSIQNPPYLQNNNNMNTSTNSCTNMQIEQQRIVNALCAQSIQNALSFSQNCMPCARLQKPAPAFTASAVVDGALCTLSLESFRNHYVALVFYPRDFSSLCAAELAAFSERARHFDELNCKLIAVSTDSELAHLAFRAAPQTQCGLPTCAFPLVSDASTAISTQYGVLLDCGAAMRATYIIDPCGIVRSLMVNDIAVARNIDEVLRCVAAIKTADEKHCVCPVNWTVGCKTIQPQLAEERLYFPH